MKKTTSLCFTDEGLINPDSIAFMLEKDIGAVVLFGDGSQKAYEHMQSFDLSVLQDKVSSIGVAKTPLYEIRVINAEGKTSKPHYVYSEDIRVKWMCSKICANYITISISDITSQSGTQALLDYKKTELVCYLAYRMWSVLREAEDRLSFPAMAIDRMTRWTYSLTPQTIDIVALRRESGLSSLEYNTVTDMLSITVADDIFTVKLSILNEFYGAFILPLFNRISGRRLRLKVSIIGSTGKASEPDDMSYGELGRVVDEMMSYTKERIITADTPMNAQDLLTFAKKVQINDESCLWPGPHQSISDLLAHAHSDIVRRHPTDDDRCADDSTIITQEFESIHSATAS